MPTRKATQSNAETAGARLQWGRVVADAEGRADGVQLPALRTASMGPRRCRRGRPANVDAREFKDEWLQWGRVVADAEGEEGELNAYYIEQLQWGRVVADAEGNE